MKPLSLIVLTLAVALPATWFAARHFSGSGGPGGRSGSEPPTGRRVLLYQSPMHPWVKSDKPGQCTICGMDLEPVYEGQHAAGPALDDIVSLSPAQVRVLQVQTTGVESRPLRKTLRVSGRIEDDATRHRILSAYVDGRIERLHVNVVGAEVTEGQPLVDVYSPTLLQAEREYRQLTGDLQKRTALRLRQLGLTPAQIEALPTKDPDSLVSQILSPIGGSVVVQSIYEGQYVKEGDKLFELADFTTMWFVFPVYEQDLSWIKPGQTVDLTTPSLPGRSFSGRIAFIDPNLGEAIRAARVRVELANPVVDGRRALLHRLSADGLVRIELPPVLSVARTAVLQTSSEAVVFVDEGAGAYRRRVIETGRIGDDSVEVLSGLNEGQQVVTHGNLLLDGQAEMNRAVAAPPAPPSAPAAEELTPPDR